jgi:hypothetical protein
VVPAVPDDGGATDGGGTTELRFGGTDPAAGGLLASGFPLGSGPASAFFFLCSSINS